MQRRRAGRTGCGRVNVRTSWHNIKNEKSGTQKWKLQYLSVFLPGGRIQNQSCGKFPVSLGKLSFEFSTSVDTECGILFFIETEDADRTAVVTAYPGFQPVIVFKYVHTYRVTLAGERDYFFKTLVLNLENLYGIATITGYK